MGCARWAFCHAASGTGRGWLFFFFFLFFPFLPLPPASPVVHHCFSSSSVSYPAVHQHRLDLSQIDSVSIAACETVSVFFIRHRPVYWFGPIHKQHVATCGFNSRESHTTHRPKRVFSTFLFAMKPAIK